MREPLHRLGGSRPFGRFGILIAGMASLALAMGIGRFAYTPLLPMMKSYNHFTTSYASLLASVNYAGYLLGAVVSRQRRLIKYRKVLLFLAAAASTVTTFAMAASDNHILWLLIRLISGVASAFVFVYASAIVLDAAAAFKDRRWPGILYSGVGTGILVSALTIANIRSHVSWSQAWLVMGGLSALLLVFTLGCFQEVPIAAAQVERRTPHDRRRFYALLIAYFAEAIGYIVPATFIVLFIDGSPVLHAYGDTTWAIVGATAIPSTLVWNWMCGKFNRSSVTAFAMLVQAVGVAAPVFAPNAFGAFVAAATLGLTFVGISSLILGAARDLSPYESSRTIGYFTVVFGVGQIVGPLMVAQILRWHSDYNAALLVAAALLFVGSAVLNVSRIPGSKYAPEAD